MGRKSAGYNVRSSERGQKRGRERNTGAQQQHTAIMPNVVPPGEPCLHNYTCNTRQTFGASSFTALMSTACQVQAPPDLGTALRRMGLLPGLPALKTHQAPQASSQNSAKLEQLNDFLDHSYSLQQRGHQLWVAEQLELQRGAHLAIISPPQHLRVSTQAAGPTVVRTKPSDAQRQQHESLLSPHSASGMLAEALGHGPLSCISPSMAGSAAAQLLSPTAIGLHPLLLQDVLRHGAIQRQPGLDLSSTLPSPRAQFNCLPNHHTFQLPLPPAATHPRQTDASQEGVLGSGGVLEDLEDHLLPARTLMYSDYQDPDDDDPSPLQTQPKMMHTSGGMPGSQAQPPLPHHSTGLLETGALRVQLKHGKHGFHVHGWGTTPTHVSSLFAPGVLEGLGHTSPLSPADLLVSGVNSQTGLSLDMGLLGSYAIHPHVTGVSNEQLLYQPDIHAELRLAVPDGAAGSQQAKRVRR